MHCVCACVRAYCIIITNTAVISLNGIKRLDFES